MAAAHPELSKTDPADSSRADRDLSLSLSLSLSLAVLASTKDDRFLFQRIDSRG